jgi:hypothetical protein
VRIVTDTPAATLATALDRDAEAKVPVVRGARLR